MSQCKKLNARDKLAASFGADDVGQIIYNNLSLKSRAALVGMAAPVDPGPSATLHQRNVFQIQTAKFDCKVAARVRYMLADAMLEVSADAAR